MAAEHRTGEDEVRPPLAGRIATGADPVGEQEVEEETSWVTWQSVLYLFVLCVACVFLSTRTALWWIVPVLGAATPLALAVLDRSFLKLGGSNGGKAKERELLEVLAERGEITPATAASHTSLTINEAARMLDELAGKGYLRLLTRDGIIAYALPDHDRSLAPEGVPNPVEPQAEGGVSPERLEDPLSERELEVLVLLASGRTNAEISEDLFVAVGTVKSHLNSIYRKLGAGNRAQAVTRARQLDLLR